jgi:hypothetical protein
VRGSLSLLPGLLRRRLLALWVDQPDRGADPLFISFHIAEIVPAPELLGIAGRQVPTKEWVSDYRTDDGAEGLGFRGLHYLREFVP